MCFEQDPWDDAEQDAADWETNQLFVDMDLERRAYQEETEAEAMHAEEVLKEECFEMLMEMPYAEADLVMARYLEARHIQNLMRGDSDG